MTYSDIITYYHAKSKLSEAVFHKTKMRKRRKEKGGRRTFGLIGKCLTGISLNDKNILCLVHRLLPPLSFLHLYALSLHFA